MLWLPAVRLPVLQLAVLGLPAASATAPQLAIGLPSAVKPTLPDAALPATLAMKVTVVPAGAGLPELDSVVVVAVAIATEAAATAAPASTMPAPQSAVLQPPEASVGNARAVVCNFDITWAGVSDGFRDSISEAMPATCGVAMLVPW